MFSCIKDLNMCKHVYVSLAREYAYLASMFGPICHTRHFTLLLISVVESGQLRHLTDARGDLGGGVEDTENLSKKMKISVYTEITLFA